MKVTCYTPDRWTCESTGHNVPCHQEIYKGVVRMHITAVEQTRRTGPRLSLSISKSNGDCEFGMEVGELALSLDEDEVYIGQM